MAKDTDTPAQTSIITQDGTPQSRELATQRDEEQQKRIRRYMLEGHVDFDQLSKDAAIVNLDLFSVGEPFDKDNLVGTEFVVIDWRELGGTFGNYAFVEIVTRDNKHGFFTDGGTGILPKLIDVQMATGRKSGLYAPRGLTRSEYDTEVEGRTVHGVTFYIA